MGTTMHAAGYEVCCGGARTKFAPDRLDEARAYAEQLAQEKPIRVTLRAVEVSDGAGGTRIVHSSVVWDSLCAEQDAERQDAVRAEPHHRARVSPLAERLERATQLMLA